MPGWVWVMAWVVGTWVAAWALARVLYSLDPTDAGSLRVLVVFAPFAFPFVLLGLGIVLESRSRETALSRWCERWWGWFWDRLGLGD